MRHPIVVAMLCLAAFLSMVGVGMAVSSLPAKLLSLSGSVRSASWLASAFAVSYVLLQGPSGRMADRFGARPLLALGFALMAVSGLCYALAQSPAAIFFGRFLQGAGEVPVWAAAPALLSRLEPQAKGRAIGLYGASFQLGLTVGPLAVLVLSWPFLGLAGLCAVCVLSVLLLVREPVSEKSEQGQASACRALPVPSWTANAATLLSGGSYALSISLVPAFLLAAGLGRIGVQLSFTLVYLGFGLAQYGAGSLSDRLGRGGFMAGGAALAGLGLAGLSLVPLGLLPVGTAPALLLAAGLGLGTYAAATLAAQCESVACEHRGLASGRYFLWWGLGYFAVPQAVGALGPGMGCAVLGGLLLALGVAMARRN